MLLTVEHYTCNKLTYRAVAFPLLCVGTDLGTNGSHYKNSAASSASDLLRSWNQARKVENHPEWKPCIGDSTSI